MNMKAMLQRLWAKYGEIGMYSASWRGSYEQPVPDTLIRFFATNEKTGKRQQQCKKSR